jgi:drug/metabolite transporter (DMT)-like permease
MMLLMRGGVLVIAPIVDALSRRRVQWPSWVALGLSLGAVAVATGPGVDVRVTLAALLDLAVYLMAYFIRLRAMSRLAKSDDASVSIRYFVEEQLVATPSIVLTLVVLALVGEGQVMMDIRQGFTQVFERGRVLEEVGIGLLSQGTGIFGALILLDRRENAFTVPVNRASSILAGVLATAALSVWLGQRPVDPRELLGAGLVMVAMIVLSAPTLWKARKAVTASIAPP